ncbi:TPA: hypothetical protein ACHUBB_004140 [Klebsiella pneumoniae]|nr:hypothetical protein [Klebsiella pneumoniae]
MTKSTITRERLEEIVSDPMINQGSEFAMMARMALAAMDSEPVAECEKLATENFRTAMEGIGHIRRTLDETFGGLHGTHVEPDVLDECKAICDAIYAAYRHTQPALVVPEEVLKSLDLLFHRSYFRRWVKDPQGYVSGSIPVRDLVNVVLFADACRAAMLAAAPQEVKSE